MTRVTRVFGILLLAATLGAGDCRLSTNGSPCTEEFRIVYVTALDSLGAPAPGVATTHVLPRNGRVLTVPQDPVLNAAGVYVVLSDAQRTVLRETGDVVRMAGSKDAATFTQDFLFDVPQGCHVRKVEGPDTVMLRSITSSSPESS